MVHRDIKPANLIVTAKEKEVKILDFGLVRGVGVQSGTRQTKLQTFMGTPEYVAPEQAGDARNADIRADIYSLGCTLYFLLAGRPPFKKDTIYNTIMAQVLDEPQPLTDLRKDIPAELWAVVAKMMAKKPAERYQTPIEVAKALQPIGTGPAKAKRKNAGLAEAGLKRVPNSSSPPIPPPLAVPVPQAISPEIDRSPFDDLVEASPSIPMPASKKVKRGRAMFVALALVLLAPLGVWLAVVMLRVETSNGTLIVEMNDDEVEARIKNGKLILSGPDGSRYTLTPNERRKDLKTGSYTIRVEGADGLVLDTPKFTLKKGGEVKVRVTLAPNPVVKKGPPGTPVAPKTGDIITNSIGMKLVRISAGTFMMGSPADEKDRGSEEEQHEVEITKAFWMGIHEVTQKQFKEVMGYNPSHFSKDGEGKSGLEYNYGKPAGGKEKVPVDTSDFPVENVSH